MKRDLPEFGAWFLALAFSLTAIWLGYATTTEVHRDIVRGLSFTPVWDDDGSGYLYDGSSVVFTRSAHRGFEVHFFVTLPPTIFGFVACWWPVIASLGVCLLVFVATLTPVAGPLLRKRIRVPRVRLTLSRLMIVIGTVSAWLWLSRLDSLKRAAGTLIIGFVLHAGFRTGYLARESRAARTPATVLSRAGVAGYSVVLVLSIAWLITMLVWDSCGVARH